MKTASECKGLAQQIKQLAIEAGADLVGVATVDRFRSPAPFSEQEVSGYLPTGYEPERLLPGARSVVVLGIGQLVGVLLSNVGDLNTTYPFGCFGYVHLNRSLNTISYRLARWLEERSWMSVPLGQCGGARFDYHEYSQGQSAGPLHGIFSAKRAAVLAGMGRRARNGLVATPRFGTRVRLGAVITTAPLDGDPLLEGTQCPPNCSICVKACPTGAISAEGRVNHIRCYSDRGRRGTSVAQVMHAIRKAYPIPIRDAEYLTNDREAIDGTGNRLCRAACMAFCPLGENSSPVLLRQSKKWINSLSRIELTP
ncbi:MAG: hypothetical protein V1737_04705 [Chloroflexota bacterium]